VRIDDDDDDDDFSPSLKILGASLKDALVVALSHSSRGELSSFALEEYGMRLGRRKASSHVSVGTGDDCWFVCWHQQAKEEVRKKRLAERSRTVRAKIR